jgi:hypothetical protein
MRTIRLVFALLLAATAWPQAFAASAASVRAILVTATNQKREADPKLAAFEAELQRNLPLSSFRWVGEGATSVGGAPSAISLPRGHRLEVEGTKAGGGIDLKVHWTQGGSVIMSTSLSLNPGVPVVLGRRPSDDSETPIILLIAR